MRAVFLDRDGTIIEDLIYESNPERLRFMPNSIEGLKRFQDAGFLLFVVTNQSGVKRGFLSLERLKQIHRRMLEELRKRGIRIHMVQYCPHHMFEGCGCRKPRTHMVKRILDHFPDIDLTRSVVIGDRETDVELGKNIGSRTVFLTYGKASLRTNPDFIAKDLLEAAEKLLDGPEQPGKI